MEVKNCSAIVSGGASGMGAATARALSSAGAKVAILDLNLEAGEKLASEINGMAVACNVTDPASVQTALQQVKSIHGSARICINCAGIVKGKRIVSKEGPMPLDEFKHVIDVNLVGTFNLMRLAAADMTHLDPLGQSGERGIIINTASIAAFEGQIGQAAYSASKGGIVSLTLPAARELAKFGIRVVTIAPGLVNTPMYQSFTPEAREALGSSIPFPKRPAHSEEFAKLALHIIDNEMINGTVIRLDGALRLPASL